MKQPRYSKQRETILELLRGTMEHPTAEWVYQHIREDIPNISLGTVYRNLNYLVEQGLAVKVDHDGEAERFDARTDSHHHLICEKCGDIIDYDGPVTVQMGPVKGFEIREQRVQIYGLCSGCARKSKG